ncbi:unnamed protein product [Paramecium sonneborni]|uniref:Uncharacterized protein n=1 Tax=Paramecium sonneborni TaxID=65129 RepID=A0A8S1KAM2_9CILI|nr:unnamed protein product [Paramecium sonneborni]
MRTLRYRTAKQEMNDISKALQSVDVKIRRKSIYRDQENFRRILCKDNYISQIRFSSFNFGRFTRRTVTIRFSRILLDQFWMNTIQKRIELISQANRNQQLYEERGERRQIYNNQTLQFIILKLRNLIVFVMKYKIFKHLQRINKRVQRIVGVLKIFQEYLRFNEGIAIRVDKSLISKASAIQDALKQIGNDVNCQVG